METDDHFRFVSLLALELENADIRLPSLPDVVLKIRKMLESDDCDFGKISQAVSVDPVLVSRLFVFANSAYYNRANLRIETLDAAIGRLYILTKAEDLPEFLGDPASLDAVMNEWNPQISKSIIESWGFPQEVAESSDPASYLDHDTSAAPSFVDIMVVAKMFVDGKDEKLKTFFEEDGSCIKLGIDEDKAADVMVAYRDKLQSMQQSLT